MRDAVFRSCARDIVQVGSATAREWVPSFGAGASYAIMPELEIVAEYERYKDVADAYNVDLASVGLRYNF